ncbi:MAG: ferritin [Omnitrophica WOR_2 bacterium GWF2_38_59]|nr:MAG: ferritin [Omnitrophica WOR_2 bacterium GWF2_38_59]OGX46999.1 MAG: ferritin [Omnitrophica WOR_2 bacterium RIFOXYA2_FULL_38_17]OGX50941.1 MAG: ferritin [Omnitrophica WOR_2 bacterium RIFOXYA12_FULL_38_10]OGX55604.1 MAG: ferritin [Omnitrophica WOR_2 bacterium RIFOXYB2_FULL_38_16]OGX56772.1 MAG: ferritin [Omnitrophica WOR_2 bacterium RIFOXYC2_FULL_38_12]
MDKKLEKLINEQITKEYYSSYLYLSMAAYFESMGLTGFTAWMKIQAEEEMIHMRMFFTYVNERGGRVILESIDKPPADFESIKDVFEQTLEHEKLVTASINNLYKVSKDINDNASTIFLQWFITEQVEEEKNAKDIIDRLALIKEDPMGILMIDKELGSRPQPVAPAAA